MKKFISILLALMPCAVVFASEKTDTLLNVARADSVVIIDNTTELKVNIIEGNTQQELGVAVEPGAERVFKVSKVSSKSRKSKTQEINIPGKTQEINIPGKKRCSSLWDGIIGGLGFGMVNAVDGSSALSHQMTKSWEISLLYVLGVRYQLHKWSSLNFGLGITGRSLNLGDGTRYVADGSGITAVAFPDGAVKTHADIYTFSIDMPLLFRQYLPIKLDGHHRMSFFLGGILNFNTYSSVSSHYLMPDNRLYDEKLDGKHHKPVTWQLMGGIYFNNWLGAYVKYMPVEPMKHDVMSYKPLSVGLQVSF